MSEEIPAPAAVPALLATQLMAAEVYSYFLHVSSKDERDLWKKLLTEELEHISHLRQALENPPPDLKLPEANAMRMREIRDQALGMGTMFLTRLEGALRLESAELDFGLEGVAARRLKKSKSPFDYPGDILKHIMFLLDEAERYSESRNIGIQISRLHELLEASLSETTRRPRGEGTHIRPEE